MATKKQAPDKFYGWRNTVILGAIFFVTMALVFNTANICNSYMKLDESMHINATTLGLGFSLYILIQGWAAPLIGRFGQKMGNFKPLFIAGCAIVTICALILCLFLNDAMVFLIVFGILMSIGTGLAGQVPTDTTVAYWFNKKRGLNLGIILGCSGLAAIIGPPIVNGIIEASGGDWHSGWWFLVACGAVTFILSLFLYTRPEDYGQKPYGADDGDDDDEKKKNSKPIKVYQRKDSLSFKEGIKSPNTWLIMLGGGVGQFVYTFTVSFGMLHFMNLGFAAVMITAAISARGVGSSVGGFIPGFFADRIEPIRMMGISLLITGILFCLGAYTENPVIMFLFFFFTGWSIGSQKSLCPTALSNWLGTENFARVYGYTLLVLATLCSIIPVAIGALFDATGTYAPGAIIIGACAIIGAICCFIVRYPKKDKELQEGAPISEKAEA